MGVQCCAWHLAERPFQRACACSLRCAAPHSPSGPKSRLLLPWAPLLPAAGKPKARRNPKRRTVVESSESGSEEGSEEEEEEESGSGSEAGYSSGDEESGEAGSGGCERAELGQRVGRRGAGAACSAGALPGACRQAGLRGEAGQ